jgi:5-methylcytosine-specific restriction endonuclease McrA
MQDSVLVLNANYQPIHVCSTRRAITLIFANKASLIQNGRGYIYTVSQSYPRPSIIRLDRMVIRPRLRVQFSRHEIFRRDHHTCQYCGKVNGELTLDHVIPKKMGGEHTWTNVVTACIVCNHHKGSRTPEQANMKLLAQPVLPPASAVYYFQTQIANNQDWEQYIKGW